MNASNFTEGKAAASVPKKRKAAEPGYGGESKQAAKFDVKVDC